MVVERHIQDCRPGDRFYYKDDSRKWLCVSFKSFDKRTQKVHFEYSGNPYEVEYSTPKRFSVESPDRYFNSEKNKIFITKTHRKWPVLIQTTHWDQPFVARFMKSDKKLIQSKFECVAPYSGLLDFAIYEKKTVQKFWLHHAEIKQVEAINPLALKSDSHRDSELYKHLISPHLAHTLFSLDHSRAHPDKQNGSIRNVLYEFASRLTLREQVQIITNYDLFIQTVDKYVFGFQKNVSQLPLADCLFIDRSIIPDLTIEEARPRSVGRPKAFPKAESRPIEQQRPRMPDRIHPNEFVRFQSVMKAFTERAEMTHATEDVEHFACILDASERLLQKLNETRPE